MLFVFVSRVTDLTGVVTALVPLGAFLFSPHRLFALSGLLLSLWRGLRVCTKHDVLDGFLKSRHAIYVSKSGWGFAAHTPSLVLFWVRVSSE